MTINVFIVDDSATARTALRLILESSEDINVTGVASNPLIALKRMNKLWPDVIISDIEMPEMNGIEFLQYLQRNRPTPFIVFSNHTGSSAVSSIDALFKGAVDIIPKPNFSCADSLDETSLNILNAVRAAARMEMRSPVARHLPEPAPEAGNKRQQRPEKAARPVDDSLTLPRADYSVIAIGSSTGGTVVIEKILTALDANSPGVVIVQHMPELFTRAFANRINQFCRITVKEAEDGDQLTRGMALIAPGGKHMTLLGRPGSGYRVQVFDGEYVNRHKPSVDVLFNSVADVARTDALGIILTGMGKDGAKGLWNMKSAGADTIAQSEEDCAVYGMPKAAKAMDAVDYDMSADEIAFVLARLGKRQ
ncbi:MAG TPA: chemotaxis response regulator protein-glutamate methylesterase [Pseudomonadales bacterium]